MIPRNCKRLAEVDFPIAEVSRHAAREKSIRHGHPSTLHLWWARRPLASSRAVLLALLLPDPCDEHCPGEFKQEARKILRSVRQLPASDAELRRGLLSFIANFANWKNAADRTHLDVGRALVRAAHGEEPPLVVDPFAGGGSIPLEALRLGCEAFASDLNPVACLILKVLLEDIPRHGPALAAELRRVGGEIKRQAQQELEDLFPRDPDGGTPIAYLWARTVRCEAPNCGAEVPLMRSFWLCRKPRRKRALRHRVEQRDGEPPSLAFEVFEPQADKEVRGGTVARARATCLCCGAVLPPDRVRAQLAAQRGGADVTFDAEGRRTGGARMTAVVTLKPGQTGRHFRLPVDADYEAVRRSQARLADILNEWKRCGGQGLCPVPDEPAPTKDTHRAVGSQIPLYGITTFGDLFTARQKVVLAELGRLLSRASCSSGGRSVLALSISRLADIANCLCRWETTKHQVRNLFTRQAYSMVWDFAEASSFGEQAGDHSTTLSTMVRVIDQFSTSILLQGHLQSADATDHPLPSQAASVWFTDPPYYDAIPYSDLSDFFFVWLKRTLPDHPLLRDPFDPDNPLSPKSREAVQCEKVKDTNGAPKDRGFYEGAMARAFAEGRRVLSEDGVSSVVFAHKTTEGWEALLSGMVRGGWTITGSWPIATEMANKVGGREKAILLTSIHLICRPRPEDAPIGDWAEVLRELPTRVADWIERLQGEGIRGADLVFACIGPALEIFSRYRVVETAEGDTVDLRAYLEKVWEVVGRAALQQVLGTAEAQARNGLSGALEEDARLTALFLWTMQSTTPSSENQEQDEGADEEAVAKAAGTGFALPFDVVRRFAQPMGIDLDAWTGRIISQDKGTVRLLPVAKRVRTLFGQQGSQAARWLEQDDPVPAVPLQGDLFPEPREDGALLVREPRPEYGAEDGGPGDTTLDRVHTAMLLQSSGHANALRSLIGAEQERGPGFERLANALSALYPRGCEEKRLLDAMLLAVPR